MGSKQHGIKDCVYSPLPSALDAVIVYGQNGELYSGRACSPCCPAVANTASKPARYTSHQLIATIHYSPFRLGAQ